MNPHGKNDHKMTQSSASLLSGSAVISVSLFVTVFSQFLTMLLISHRLGDSGLGLVSLTLRIISFLTMLIALGLPPIVTQMISSSDSPDHQSTIAATALVVLIPATVILSLLLLACGGELALLVGIPELSPLIFLQGISIPFSTLGMVMSSITRGRKQFGRYGIATACAPVVSLFLIVGWFETLTPLIVITAGVMAAVFGMLVSFLAALPLKMMRPDMHVFKNLLVPSAPLLVVGLAGIFIDSIDIIVMGLMHLELSQIGVYTAVFSISSYLRFIFEPFSLVLLPIVSSSLAKHDYGAVESIMGAASRLFVLIFVPAALLCAVLSHEIIALLFPSSFLVGAFTLSILAISATGLAVYYLYSRLLIAMRRTRALAGLLIVAALVDLALTPLMISLAGLPGAGVSSAVTFILMGIGSFYLASGGLGIRSYIAPRDAASAVILFTLCWGCRNVFASLLASFGFYSPLLLIGLVLMIALLTEYVMKPIGKKEYLALSDFIDITPVLKVIGGPLKKIILKFTK